ncbi:cell division protein SepF [Quadrisphaera sp. DSM 44207]|uniref:cell division protein SepF n=1 Tax=Quadrisphaera sp. DSM 44207 TaxID=1881057 RepID=UPI000884D01C|nr:cell division inhibitor SepF [Quadrisphaera sp. DSM 44207]
MAGALRKTMVYLGLAEDDPRYQELHDVPDGEWVEVDEQVEVVEQRHAEVTPITRDRPVARLVSGPATTDLRRITTIHPRTYNEAKSIGESFRGGVPVIMNLTDMSDADAKRLVDFSAGLVFGLHGSIERVTNKVFLLSPAHVEVTGEAPVASATLFNQS